jgi:hypothetical protein
MKIPILLVIQTERLLVTPKKREKGRKGRYLLLKYLLIFGLAIAMIATKYFIKRHLKTYTK